MNVQAATIQWQWGQVKVGKVARMKLVDEVCYFLGEIAQLAELA